MKTTPIDLRDVLAQIETQSDLGKSSWYEVVYHNGEEWCSYAGSDTFSTYGYNVVQWKYVDEIFNTTCDDIHEEIRQEILSWVF